MTHMKRKLGRSDISVSALGLGCWAIGGPAWRERTPVGWGDVDDAESLRALDAAVDAGITFFDTADVYGAGHSERMLGKFIPARRADLVIATKFSGLYDEETKQLTGSDASPAYIRTACDASLARLNTDYIDLYQFHNGGYDLDAAVEVRDTLEDLVKAGKIRYYGWSTDDPERASMFAEGEHCVAVQHQMNVLNDNPQMVTVCETLNLASINRGPLAMGLLSGKYNAGTTLPENDVRGPNAPTWMQYFKDGKPDQKLIVMLDDIREILTSGGRTLVQGALAWLWGRTEMTVPIPGFKTVDQVVENAGAMEKGPLTSAQMTEISAIFGR